MPSEGSCVSEYSWFKARMRYSCCVTYNANHAEQLPFLQADCRRRGRLRMRTRQLAIEMMLEEHDHQRAKGNGDN